MSNHDESDIPEARLVIPWHRLMNWRALFIGLAVWGTFLGSLAGSYEGCRAGAAAAVQHARENTSIKRLKAAEVTYLLNECVSDFVEYRFNVGSGNVGRCLQAIDAVVGEP